MPYLEAERLLFIHIPKTGGSSVEQFFGMDHEAALWFPSWDRDQDGFLTAHADVLAGQAKGHYEPQHYPPILLRRLIPEYDACFKFTFVRHPYTRMLSEYYYHQGRALAQVSYDRSSFGQMVPSFGQIIPEVVGNGNKSA